MEPRACEYIGRIPVRNLWLLMLYASELFRMHGSGKSGFEDNPDHIADLVAEILAHAVADRIRRNLSSAYQSREDILSRVRGRIDVLTTDRRQLIARGKVACRFDELTVDTPRNRFVRAALSAVARVVHRSDLAHRCRTVANALKSLGVSAIPPTRAEIGADRLGRNDANDRLMVAAATLAFDLALPTEDFGAETMPLVEREIVWVRNLFEKAVGGFYKVVLEPHGWQVATGKRLNWRLSEQTAGIDGILPSMVADIILDQVSEQRRIIIDTKFTSILSPGRYRETLRSGYLYQIYAYLRSQEHGSDGPSDHAEGLLLHPAIGELVEETVAIQGHSIRFATVDLSASAKQIRTQLLKVVDLPMLS
jgi:5-methylcytosine-specific restriction enzyme subunit McrC